MTSYNYGQYIAEAIDSVLIQTYKDWELIIIDDGSDDDSMDVITKYTDKYPDKIRCYTHKDHSNKGIKDTNEFAFAKVNGKYTAFLESDDIWKPDCLEKKVNALNLNPSASIVFSGIDLLLENDFDATRHRNYLKYSRFIGVKCIDKPKNLLRMILFRNPIISFSNIVIRSEILSEFKIDKEHETWSDWQLVIHAALLGDFTYIDEELLYWRLHNKSHNFGYMKTAFETTSHSFKLMMSKRINTFEQRSMNTKLPKYPFPMRLLIYKFLHDLSFSLKHPKVAWSEIKRKFEK